MWTYGNGIIIWLSGAFTVLWASLYEEEYQPGDYCGIPCDR